MKTTLTMREGGLHWEFMGGIIALNLLNIWSKNWLRLSKTIATYKHLLINSPLHSVSPSPITCAKLHHVFPVSTIAGCIDIL